MSPETVPQRPSVSPVWRGRGFRALGVLLYALLLDAALETSATVSATRWWVAIPVATYLVLSAWLRQARPSMWHRVDPSTRASVSFLMLLGVLAVTAWLPGGVSDGVRMLRQPTSIVLSAVTATAVVWGASFFMRTRSLPSWGRAVVALLAVYAVAAFTVGELTGISYFDLLHGESLWHRLPFWLQGAPVGAIVLLPVAVLFQVGATLLRWTGPPLRRCWTEVLALSLSVLIAMAGVRGPSSAGYGVVEMRMPDFGSGGRVGLIVFARGESGAQPVGRSDRFRAGTKVVYAFLDFEGLRVGDTVMATWFKGAEKLRDQTLRISAGESADFAHKPHVELSMTFDGGARPGGYFLEIRINDGLAQFGGFAVDPMY
jgi:hypothetical protein